MKKGVIFFSLILFSVIFAGLVVALNNDKDPNDYFYCHDSDNFDPSVGDGYYRGQDLIVKGTTYGREKLYSDNFVTKEDFCVIIDKIFLGPSGDEKTVDAKFKELNVNENSGATMGSITSGKQVAKEFCTSDGECKGYLIYEGQILEEVCENGSCGVTVGNSLGSQETNDYLVMCSKGDCNSAKRESCEGENCAVLEYDCSDAGVGPWEYLEFIVKHPILSMQRILDKSNSETIIHFSVPFNPCEFGCSDGACLKEPKNSS